MERPTPEVAVIMAVFEPEPKALSEQIASVAAQANVDVRLLAVIADRHSDALVTRCAAAHDLVVELVVPEATTSSYESFEAGLTAALDAFPDVELFALSDQDDIWFPNKLSVSVARLRRDDAALVHCDAEVTADDGSLIAPSLHRLERRLCRTHLRDLLLENTVTGMTAVFRREVAEAAAPFPGQAALFFHHDLWIALVARMVGGITRLDAPLVSYRQHGGNLVGAVTSPAPKHRPFSMAWRRHWGGTYYVAAYLAKALYLRAEEVIENRDLAIDPRRLAPLKPYLSQRGAGLAHLLDVVPLLARGRRDLAGQSVIFCAVRLARIFMAVRETLFRGFVPALAEFDRRAFAAAPGAQPASRERVPSPDRTAPKTAASFRDQRRHLRVPVQVDDLRAPGVTLFVPSMNPTEVFAGVATAIDLGLGLSGRGHRVTFVATDMPVTDPRATRAFLASRMSGQKAAHPPGVVCSHSVRDLIVAPGETFIATAWWTAHLCHQIRSAVGDAGRTFYYLIQDFEPGFYPWNEDFAGAMESYRLGGVPIFNSAPLHNYFSERGLMDVNGPPMVFHPSIDVARYARLPRRSRKTKRIVFYGRPEVPRNLFSLGVDALDRFLSATNPHRDEVELVSVGMAHADIVFSTGQRMKSLGKIPWPDYPRFLSEVDIGLSLMLSPHPSHPPIEMAAAGARVVTNTFAGKCLSSLTPSIHSVQPTAEEVSAALREAWAAAPPSTAHRMFDLSGLGDPLVTVIDRLSDDIDPVRRPVRMSA